MSEPNTETAAERFAAFVELIARLRAPGGCPWDREQTHQSLKPMTIEEAYEVVEAIDDGNDKELASELGDLLLQVVFHAQIATDENRFTVADVIQAVSDKMVRRHPHVFAQDPASTPDQVLRNWEALKEAERADGDKPKPGFSMLDAVSQRLPALMEAFQMTTKVARVGFDWPSSSGVLAKLDEEVAEVREAAGREPLDLAAVTAEIGDLLFVTVNLARVLGVDAESALKSANRRFRRRFRHIETALRKRGRKPADATLEEMEDHWQEAKRLEREGGAT